MKEEEKADVLKQNGKRSNAKEALICHSGPAVIAQSHRRDVES
jgi:hypothetical protein